MELIGSRPKQNLHNKAAVRTEGAGRLFVRNYCNLKLEVNKRLWSTRRGGIYKPVRQR